MSVLGDILGTSPSDIYDSVSGVISGDTSVGDLLSGLGDNTVGQDINVVNQITAAVAPAPSTVNKTVVPAANKASAPIVAGAIGIPLIIGAVILFFVLKKK